MKTGKKKKKVKIEIRARGSEAVKTNFKIATLKSWKLTFLKERIGSLVG